jgi:hypothetical protein
VWTACCLGYKVNRTDLLDPRSDYNKLWVDYVAEFGEDDDAVVVVEGPTRAETIRVLEEVSEEVSEEAAYEVSEEEASEEEASEEEASEEEAA